MPCADTPSSIPRPMPFSIAITAVAARLLATPIALISLVDHERQWFKSCHGVELQETFRTGSMCGLALLGEGVLEIPDARADPRFADSPLVTGPPHIRFYAGAPLTTEDGHNIGVLCVIDRTPRSLSPEQRLLLLDLARIVVELIRLHSFSLDLRNEIAERERTEQALRTSEQRFRDFAATTSDWFWETDAELRFSWFSDRYQHQTGEDVSTRLGKRRDEVGLHDPGDDDWHGHLADLAARRPFATSSTRTRIVTASAGSPRPAVSRSSIHRDGFAATGVRRATSPRAVRPSRRCGKARNATAGWSRLRPTGSSSYSAVASPSPMRAPLTFSVLPTRRRCLAKPRCASPCRRCALSSERAPDACSRAARSRRSRPSCAASTAL